MTFPKEDKDGGQVAGQEGGQIGGPIDRAY
jgi:hypothetical protein